MSNILTSNIAEMGVVEVTYNPASQATIDTDEDTVELLGARVGDLVFVNKPTHTDGVALTDARITSADTLSLTWVNPTAGAVDPASETYLVLWVRPDSTKNAIQP